MFFINQIFVAMLLLSFAVSLTNGSTAQVLSAGLTGAKNSVETVLSFAGIMCMWSGFLKIAEKSGAVALLSRLISPLLRLVFPNITPGSKAAQHICANISANLLGVGNAATPSGIAAMEELDKINPNPAYASDEMCFFTVLNTSSLQLIPTTVIALRAAHGSENPGFIIPYVWITSSLSLLFAMLCMRKILKIRKKYAKKTFFSAKYKKSKNSLDKTQKN